MSIYDFASYVPLRVVTVDEIIARMDADVNAGIGPENEEFTDTTDGGFYADLRNVNALAAERAWDFATSITPAAMFVGLAFGPQLDEWGVTLLVPRKDEVKATGTVTFTGTNGTLIATNTEVATPQVDLDDEPVAFRVTAGGTIAGGTLVVPVEAVSAGARGNVVAGSVTQVISPLSGVTSITNVDAMTGGADVESDRLYRDRLLLEFNPASGSGNVFDYERWSVAFAPVGYATVEALWNGAGTVRVIVTDQQNNPVSGTVITGLQNDLDPVAGQGQGRAPIGAIVTVATPALLNITVAGTVVLASGYSLDGAGGTIAVRAQIEAAVRSYIDTLKPGGDVILERVSAQFFTVPGVYDVSGVLLNGAATNVAVSSLQVARTTTITLS